MMSELQAGVSAGAGDVVAAAPRSDPSRLRVEMTGLVCATLFGALGAVAACAKPGAASDAGPREAQLPEPTVPGLSDRGWAQREATGQGARLRLPEAAAWTPEQRGGWWALVHAPSRSSVAVRRWPEPRPVRLSACEEQLFSWRPELRNAEPIAREAEQPEAPSNQVTPDRRTAERLVLGHSVLRSVAVSEAEKASALRGFAWLVAASARTCLAVVMETRVEGPGKERALAERLVLLSDGTLRSVESRGVEERALEEP
jgi:hypothetical protein